MKLAQLKKIPVDDSPAGAPGGTGIRGTEGHDASRAIGAPRRRRLRAARALAAGGAVLLVLAH